MRSTRFRALSISALVVSAAVVGGLTATTATAAAAPLPAKVAGAHKADVDLAALAQSAHAHGVAHRHSTSTHKKAAVDDPSCFTQYGNNPTDPASSTRFAERMDGSDRYNVGVCVSSVTWNDYGAPDADPYWNANAVVLARGDIYPDALAGGPLAAQVQGPLLLTKSTQLLPQVQAEIQRVLAPGGKVFLLGSTASISDGINTQLKALGYNTQRISGKDRYEVAINIAKVMPATNLFFVTNGLDYPDALSAGTAAAIFTTGARYSDDPDARPVAMLFTKGSTMPASTKAFALERLDDFQGYWGLYTAGRAGDQATVSAFGAENIVDRFVGSDRYQVATMIASAYFPGSWGFGLTNGLNFPDALTGSALLAQLGEPLLLASPTKLSPYTKSLLQSAAGAAPTPASIEVIGGPSSVSDSVMFQALAAFTPAA